MRNLVKSENIRSAFTLAEVLVTLGIIGVVSAMTVPSLMSNYRNQSYTTQLHKVYSEFQQAAQSQITSKNAVNLLEAGVRSDAAMGTFLANQFKIVKTCTGSPSDCLATNYRNINGGSVTVFSDSTAPCVVIASGAAICAKYSVSSATVDGTFLNIDYIQNLVGDLIVDVNAQKGPNIVGRDLFVLGIYSDGSLNSALPGLRPQQAGAPILTNLAKCKSASTMSRQSNAAYCFNEILDNNWKMNY